MSDVLTVRSEFAEHLNKEQMDVELICQGYLIASTDSPFQTKWVVTPTADDAIICRLPRRINGTIEQASDASVLHETVMTIQIGPRGVVHDEQHAWTVLWECVGAFALTQWYQRNDNDKICYIDDTSASASCVFVKPDLFVHHVLEQFGIDLIHELEHRWHFIFEQRERCVLDEWFE